MPSKEERKEFLYEFGGKVYHQRSMVLGQLRQILALAMDEGISLRMDMGSLVKALESGGALHRAIAIVLIEEGRPLREKDLDALAEELEFSMPVETATQVVKDFFDCTPVEKILDALGAAAGVLLEKTVRTLSARSTRPSSSSAAEIS